MSFDALESQGSLLEKLTASLETKSGFTDDRMWKPKMGKGGTGSATIRFLPPSHGNELPWVQRWQHNFNVNGDKKRLYIEQCPTTVGRKCPVCDANTELWKTKDEKDKALASYRKRKLKYFANIYVVKDPANPSNEGKVWIFEFGPKIFEKITGAMKPKFADIEPIDPTNLWHGANFNMRICMQGVYWNYDESSFGTKETLGDFSKDQLREIYSQQYDLSEFTKPEAFKSYEKLQQRFEDLTSGYNAAPKLDAEVRFEESNFNSNDIMPSSPSVSSDLKEELNNLNTSASNTSADNHDYFDNLMGSLED